jgi:hypothetical protein
VVLAVVDPADTGLSAHAVASLVPVVLVAEGLADEGLAEGFVVWH